MRGTVSWLVVMPLVGSILSSHPARGQDSHYWSEQYGTRAALLGGPMIGSVRDLSATYYNPGATALHGDSRFLLSARAYRKGTLTLDDGAGEGIDLTSSSQRPLPTFLAVPIDFDWLGKHRIVYSALTRQQFDIDLSTYRIDDRDVLPAPGDEQTASAYTARAELRETWTGLTWAYPLTERVGIGVTPYLVIRSQGITSQTLIQAATTTGDVAIATRYRNRSYRHYRSLAKIGLSGEFGRWSVGLTTTTPSVSISGSGRAAFNGSLAGQPDEDDVLAANVQPELSSTFESGWTVGAGLGLELGSTRFHASAEWFQSMGPLTVLDAEDFTAQTGSEPLVNDMTTQLESVVNWGVGVEQSIGSAMLFLGVAMDQSAADPNAPPETTTVLTSYDLWRYSGGASFRVGNSEFMLGIGYAAGSQPFPRVVEVGEVQTGLELDTDDVRFKYTQWTVVLGYEFNIGRGGDDGEGSESR